MILDKDSHNSLHQTQAVDIYILTNNTETVQILRIKHCNPNTWSLLNPSQKNPTNLFHHREVLFGSLIDRISCCDLIKSTLGDRNMNPGNLRQSSTVIQLRTAIYGGE